MTNQVIPAEAVEAAAIILWDKEMNAEWSSVSEGFKAPFLRDARQALEAAAPHMVAGDGGNSPCWDDRKKLASIWQEHAPLPEEGLSERVYEALIEVAAWGYQRRMDEVNP